MVYRYAKQSAKHASRVLAHAADLNFDPCTL